MNIIGKKVLIRAVEEKDTEVFYKAINDPYLERFENGFNFPISTSQQKNWIQSLCISNENTKLAIEYNGEVIGYTNILNIDWKNRTAWTGIKLFENMYRGQGLGRDSVMAIMRFCFEELGLNRLEGQIIEYNEASYKLYVDKCGWKVEGKKKECVYRGNEYHDVYMVAILKTDYLKLINETNYWNS